MVELLKIADLVILPAYQMRTALSEGLIADFVGLIDGRDSDWVFTDPCKVVRVAGQRILVDGFHRVEATRRACRTRILADITDGTHLDSVRAALAANSKHGLRLTNADKRRKVIVALAHETIGNLSHRQIAELCGVSHDFVSRTSVQLSSDDSCAPVDDVSIGADGKNRPATKDDAANQRALIVAEIQANPKGSDRAICKEIGCSPSTVAKVRRRLKAQPIGSTVCSAEDILPSCDRVHEILRDFPPLEAAIQKLFTDDVRRYGQRTPVLIDEDGVLLDGRSRVVACQELGIPVRYEIFRGTESEKEAIIYSLNLTRRPMTISQLAMFLACAGL